MASFYHGSHLRYWIQGGIFYFRQLIKSARARLWNRPKWQTDPELVEHLNRYRHHISRREWSNLRPYIDRIVQRAIANRDASLINEMGAALERLGDYATSVKLRLESRRLRKGLRQKEWTGGSLAGKTLLVDFVEHAAQSIGIIVRHARLIAPASTHADHCLVLAESRLVPIFRRSFPGVEILPMGVDDEAVRMRADGIAGREELAAALAADASQIATSFVPLVADTELVEKFRNKYKAQERPVVGISWGSKSHTKDAPDFAEWNALMKNVPATFVSLQYGEVSGALRKLRDGIGDRLIDDPSVDQLTDMDSFAAQIASLDAVVSISNTAAHLTGALNVPMALLVDDGFHTFWPVIGKTTPWYPRTRLMHKAGRPWSSALGEAEVFLNNTIAKRQLH